MMAMKGDAVIPKELRFKDLVGKHVISTRELRNRGGEMWPAGTEFVIFGHWRGGFCLDLPNGKSAIRGVGKRSLRLKEET